GKVAVLTFDGRSDEPATHVYPVVAVPVHGSTSGCGDAFIASFLSTWWTSNLERSVAAGMKNGALATAWRRALPDSAYRI
ncbi:MAG: hypothetical protein ABIY38_09195, partial [Rhodococcus sp. (in: high G+C Gram-positive bacteria)]